MPRPSRTGTRGLYKDSTGRWSLDLRWRDAATGEYRRYRERLAEGITSAGAKQRAREILQSALAGNFDPNQRRPKQLREALEEYVRWCESNRPPQAKRRKKIVARFLSSFGDIVLETLSPFGVERFKRQRLAAVVGPKKRSITPATVNRDLEVLKHFVGLASSWGWISEARARDLRRVPKLKEPPGRVRYLSPNEEQCLFAALPPRVYRIVVAAVLTGMRQAEIVGLRKDAVDLEARVITLTRTKANKVRRVHVNDALASLLDEAMKSSSNEYVFVSRLGAPYTTDGVRSIFRRATARAGIENFKFHDLRHTIATRLRQKGVGIDVIADVLGHASLTMARRYAHIGAETMRTAMASLPEPSPSCEAARERPLPGGAARPRRSPRADHAPDAARVLSRRLSAKRVERSRG